MVPHDLFRNIQAVCEIPPRLISAMPALFPLPISSVQQEYPVDPSYRADWPRASRLESARGLLYSGCRQSCVPHIMRYEVSLRINNCG